jgi:hypothetical protein
MPKKRKKSSVQFSESSSLSSSLVSPLSVSSSPLVSSPVVSSNPTSRSSNSSDVSDPVLSVMIGDAENTWINVESGELYDADSDGGSDFEDGKTEDEDDLV